MKTNKSLSTRPKRRSELDLMGMLVVLGLIFFHTGQIFYGGNFFVINEPSSVLALVFVAFASMWGMPLMFLISGITIWHSLRKRTAKDFVSERIKRLLIPFIVGLILIVPPQVYHGLKADPSYQESYLQFYPRFFNVQFAIDFPLFLKGIPPDNLFQLSTMYYLIDLFIFTLLLLPVFLLMQKPPGKQRGERWAAFFHRPGAIFILALPIAVSEAILGSGFHGTWNPFAWLSLLFYGFLFTSDNRFERSLQKQWKLALILGMIAFIIWFAGLGMLYTVYQIDPFTDYSPGSVLLRFLRGFTSWFWVVAIMGLVVRGRRSAAQMTKKAEADDEIPLQVSAGAHKTTFKDRIAAYAKEAQLPFYILHQLPIVVIGFYVVQWEVGALVKYIVISLSSLLATWVLYDIGVRRTRLTRFLFGMRTKKL
jgi:hypothetical protein